MHLEASFIARPDGRRVFFAEYGPRDGAPVVFFHGGPGCRQPSVPRQEEIATEVGVRLVCPERPGFGDSTRHPGRSLATVVADTEALADALGLERFAVLGYSAGGPHALACGALLGARVGRVVTLGCGASPDDPALARQMDWPRRGLHLLARRVPWLLRALYRHLPDAKRHPDKLARRLLAGFRGPDRAVLERPEIFRWMSQFTATALAQGADGMADEVLVLMRPWGFDVAAIGAPTLLWMGSEDAASPPAVAQALAAMIRGSEVRIVDGEGHLCLFDHFATILASARA